MITIDNLQRLDRCVIDGEGDAIVAAIREDEVDFYVDYPSYAFKASIGEGFTYKKDDLNYWLVGIQGKGGNKNYNACYRRDHEPNADHKFLAKNI
jgi:hypothetical protein